MSYSHRKIRDAETWQAVRRGWEMGETAQSLAARFDVGLDALWRRRAKENWDREQPADPVPVPAEGWKRYAHNRLEAFEKELKEVRVLAEALARMMAGAALEEAPTWHLPFLYHWRADHLGDAVARADRERVRERGDPWFDDFWDETGDLRPIWAMDAALVRHLRDEWRKDVGLPDGVAEGVP